MRRFLLPFGWMVVALTAIALLFSACTMPEHFQAAGSSLEVGAYTGRIDTNGAFRQGKDFDTDAETYGFFGSVRPFEYWHMKAQAEATARAITEAQYRAEMARREKECK